MHPEPPNGTAACARCGDCCRWPGHVLLDAADLSALAAHLGLAERELIGRFTRLAENRAQLGLAEQANGHCVFLDAGRCAVYEARPRQCRDFPARWTVRGHRCPATA